MREMCSLNWITSNYMQLDHSPSTESSLHLTSRSVMDPALVPKTCSTADLKSCEPRRVSFFKAVFADTKRLSSDLCSCVMSYFNK